MEPFVIIIQSIITLGILNVWILRYSKVSVWRGGNAKNLKEEFRVYGLPEWFIVLIGFLKILLSLLLITSIWIPVLKIPAAIGIAILMIGAIFMHFKVKDPLIKSLPAATLLLLCLIVTFL
jgi:hypothetical protein